VQPTLCVCLVCLGRIVCVEALYREGRWLVVNPESTEAGAQVSSGGEQVAWYVIVRWCRSLEYSKLVL
jgi:hypothetical protein